MKQASLVSIVLVAAQFTLIALIFLPLPGFASSLRTVVGTGMVTAAVVLALWSLATMRMTTFSVMPEPVAAGNLTTKGPYRFVRHPMYVSVLLSCAGATLMQATAHRWILLACLLLVLMVKIRREEMYLKNHYSAYEEYASRTAALLPGLY